MEMQVLVNVCSDEYFYIRLSGFLRYVQVNLALPAQCILLSAAVVSASHLFALLTLGTVRCLPILRIDHARLSRLLLALRILEVG